ncbi:hypothetical protein WOLCODRAFT_161731 [Wolfiporia cocos MD-104 SS10]|uniref:Uncharacterized protein n=1 Tax=Wolfiporia cocos (strain MD-104) TaxID=742152 RepID=A0A2H3JIQ1_WOLCO|nr:hypothetical protein WOLCODRAFT_161731 [Wolfiporia cocos MD-104 SS10]
MHGSGSNRSLTELLTETSCVLAGKSDCRGPQCVSAALMPASHANLDQPWHIQIRIRNETRERRLFDAKKTIHEICKGIDKIYQDNQGNMRPPVEWRLGPEGIQLKDLYLDAVKTIPPSKSFEVELSVRRIQVKADA